MEDVDLGHAKKHLGELIKRANRGEDVRITDPSLGSVRLMPVTEKQSAVTTSPACQRLPGSWKGRFSVPDRLFEPLTDEELDWLSGERSG